MRLVAAKYMGKRVAIRSDMLVDMDNLTGVRAYCLLAA